MAASLTRLWATAVRSQSQSVQHDGQSWTSRALEFALLKYYAQMRPWQQQQLDMGLYIDDMTGVNRVNVDASTEGYVQSVLAPVMLVSEAYLLTVRNVFPPAVDIPDETLLQSPLQFIAEGEPLLRLVEERVAAALRRLPPNIRKEPVFQVGKYEVRSASPATSFVRSDETTPSPSPSPSSPTPTNALPEPRTGSSAPEVRNFRVADELTLATGRILGRVSVTTGSVQEAKVEIDGNAEYRENVRTSLSPDGSQLTISETDKVSNASITVLNGGRSGVIVTGDNFSSISVGGGAVVIGNGGMVIDSRGRVTVGGVDITQQVGGSQGIEPGEIRVVVPEGTNLDIDRTNRLNATGLNGAVDAQLRSGEVEIDGFTHLDVHASGQSTGRFSNGTGDVTIGISGQSQELGGQFASVRLQVSGQSTVSNAGTVQRARGSVSGQSNVHLSGVQTQRISSSGQSSVFVNGQSISGRGWS